MHNKIVSAFFIFLLAQTAAANEIKAMVGINTSKYLFSKEITPFEHQQRTALNGGLGISFQLTDKIILEINGIYNTNGAKIQISYSPELKLTGIYKNTNLAVPVIIKYRFLPISTPYFAVGPELIYILSHKLEIPTMGENYNVLDMTQRLNLGLTLITGYEYKIKNLTLFGELRYNRWFTNFFKDTMATVKVKSWGFFVGLALKNHVG